MTSRSLLVINYRSAALTADAIRSARTASSEPLQAVVVDNSCDPAEAEKLRGVADALVVSETNRGYAGGINLGRRSCNGDLLIVSNPDVVFAPNAIDELAAQDAAVAGPAFFWDDAHRWLLPPADLHNGRDKADEVLASRSEHWRARRDRRRFFERVAFWELARPARVRALSGAVMAIRTKDFDDAGGFDERFALYFEETDFLRRIAQLRRPIVYVPAAKCRHLYNQSAGQVASDAATRYAESERRYLEKWNGPFVARALKRLERAIVSAEPAGGVLELPRTDGVVVEASPLVNFDTAAGHFPRGRTIALPPEVRGSFRGAALYLRAVDRATGEVLATVRAVK
jgi:N-acetylglucosaminyl-diphospho-decaprenol L-rhamnosyltransferase